MRPRHLVLPFIVLAAGGVGPAAAHAAAPTDPPSPESPPASPEPLTSLEALEALDESPSECPIDLIGALEAIGVTDAEAGAVSVEHARSWDSVPVDDLVPLDLAGGVYVECSADRGETSIRLQLHATSDDGSINLLLPSVLAHGEIASDQAQIVINRFVTSEPGTPIDVSDLGEGSVAVAHPMVDGASAAGLVVAVAHGDDAVAPDEIVAALLDP